MCVHTPVCLVMRNSVCVACTYECKISRAVNLRVREEEGKDVQAEARSMPAWRRQRQEKGGDAPDNLNGNGDGGDQEHDHKAQHSAHRLAVHQQIDQHDTAKGQ